MKRLRILLILNVLKIILTPLFLLVFSPLFSQEPLFSFVHLTDLHLASDSTSTYPNANLRFNNFVDYLNQDSVKSKFDFAVISGDIVHASPFTETLLVSDLNYASTALSQLQIPYYPLIGNHENNWDEGNTIRENIFNGFSGFPSSYTFAYQNYLFIMLNCTSGFFNNMPVINARNHWLRNVLSANTDKRIILVTHISPLKMRANSPDWAYISQNDELDTIISKNPNIELVLSGHVHLNSRITKYRKNYLCTSALASFPFEYRVFKVYSDSICVETKQTPEWGISIWNDSTDSAHNTDSIYAKGVETERNFTIRICSFPPGVNSPVIIAEESEAAPLIANGVNLHWYNSLSDTIGYTSNPIPDTDNPDTITYYVTQTEGNKCESLRSKIDVYVLNKSIAQGIEVYPNPVLSNTTLFSLSIMNCNVSVFSYDGKLVSYNHIKNTQMETIDMNALPSGIYFIKIETDNTLFFKKIIKH